MAKRMTDTEKWKKAFFKSLPAEYKLLWLYLLDDCDHCGIWHVDLEVVELRLGLKLSLKKAQGLFEDRVVVFDNGTKWFLPDFIPFQYGELNDRNKMFKAIIPVLIKYDLMGHLSPINGVKVKEQDKDKDLSNNTVSNNTISTREIFLKGIEQVREEYLSPQNARAFEQIGMMYFITPDKIVLWVNAFCRKIVSEGETQKTLKDFQKHFAEWLKFQKDIQNPPTGIPPQRKMVF